MAKKARKDTYGKNPWSRKTPDLIRQIQRLTRAINTTAQRHLPKVAEEVGSFFDLHKDIRGKHVRGLKRALRDRGVVIGGVEV